MKIDGRVRDTLHVMDLKDLARVFAWLDELSQRIGLDQAADMALQLGVEEALANIYQHGYAGRSGPVAITFSAYPDRLKIELKDKAPVFNPDSLSPPDLQLDWRQRKVGGLGWHLINQVMDEVEHFPCKSRGNILILTMRR